MKVFFDSRTYTEIDFLNFMDDIDSIEQNGSYVVYATLGLWYGRIKAQKQCHWLYQAINECVYMMDDIVIFEDRYGNLHVTGYHHDGVNEYLIKRRFGGRIYSVRLNKMISEVRFV